MSKEDKFTSKYWLFGHNDKVDQACKNLIFTSSFYDKKLFQLMWRRYITPPGYGPEVNMGIQFLQVFVQIPKKV